VTVRSPLPDSYLLILVRLQIGLDDLDPLTVGKGFQPVDVRIFDQELSLDLKGFRLSEEG
jgi:hypothetical protein